MPLAETVSVPETSEPLVVPPEETVSVPALMSENSQSYSLPWSILVGSSEMTRCYTQIESPLGPLLLAIDETGLREIGFVNGRNPAQPQSGWKEDCTPLRQTIHQLRAYFAGELEKFDLPLAPEGTPFQLAVWRRLSEIPKLHELWAWPMAPTRSPS